MTSKMDRSAVERIAMWTNPPRDLAEIEVATESVKCPASAENMIKLLQDTQEETCVR